MKSFTRLLVILFCLSLSPNLLAQELGEIVTNLNTPVTLHLTAPIGAVEPLSFTIDSAPLNGTLVGEAPDLIYVPNMDYSGMDSLSYSVIDANGTMSSLSLTIRIATPAITEENPVVIEEAPPVLENSINSDMDLANFIDFGNGESASNYTDANAVFPANNHLQTLVGRAITFSLERGSAYTIVTPPSYGMLTGQVPNISYVPDEDYSGEDSFTYAYIDDLGQSHEQTVQIYVSLRLDNQTDGLTRSVVKEIVGNDTYQNAYDIAERMDVNRNFGFSSYELYDKDGIGNISGGDPTPSCGAAGNQNIWFKYTARENHLFSVYAEGYSTLGQQSMTLSLWTHDNNTWSQVACGTGNTNYQASPQFSQNVTQGTQYYIMLSSRNLIEAYVEMWVERAPTNDNFANAVLLTPSLDGIWGYNRTTTFATKEAGEPAPTCATGVTHTVWYKYVPPKNQTLVLYGYSYNAPTAIGIYKGTNLNTLTQMNCQNNNPYPFLHITLQGGQTYYFQVASTNNAKTIRNYFGTVLIDNSHDSFAGARVLNFETAIHDGVIEHYASLDSSNRLGTGIAGDPAPSCASEGMGKTQWWTFTPSYNGNYWIYSNGNTPHRALLYRGTNLATLSPIACFSDGYSQKVSLVAGQTYYFVVGESKYYVMTGELFFMGIELDSTSINSDNFTTAQSLAHGGDLQHLELGSTGTVHYQDPVPSCATNSLQGTRWYTYIPPRNSNFYFTGTSSSQNLVMALYSGTSVTSLAQQGCYREGVNSTDTDRTVLLTTNTRYYLLVGYQGSRGNADFYVQTDIAPAPDAPANATELVGFYTEFAGVNYNSTSTTSEPLCNGNRLQNTVWYKYTPFTNGMLHLVATDHDGQVPFSYGLYSGTPTSLSQINCNDSSGYEVPVTGGQTYYIMVGVNGATATGAFRFILSFYDLMSFNNFATPFVMDFTYQNYNYAYGYLFYSTVENGEKKGSCTTGTLQKSAWVKYTPRVNGVLNNILWAYEDLPNVTVWTGTSLSNLVEVACLNTASADANTTASYGQQAINLTANTTYYIQLASFNNSLGNRAQFYYVPSFEPTTVNAPANDNFANAATITGIMTVNTHRATLEAPEMSLESDRLYQCADQNGRSVWYKFTTTSRKRVILDSFTSSFDSVLHVFSGSSLDNLNLLDCNDDWDANDGLVEFYTSPNQTYYVSITGFNSHSGNAFLQMQQFDTSETIGTDTVGIYRASDRSWYIKNTNASGSAYKVFPYGDPSDKAVVGDWDGDGIDTVGIFRNGTFYLRNSNEAGSADITLVFGASTDLPVAGDWNGDGIDTIGVYRPESGTWFLTNSHLTGRIDLNFTYGLTNETPVAGDWDGDGFDTVGIFRASDRTWYLKNDNSGGNADILIEYGDPALDTPVVGDWDGNGTDTVGIYRRSAGSWFLRNTNTAGIADISFTYGLANETPVVGDWNGQ